MEAWRIFWIWWVEKPRKNRLRIIKLAQKRPSIEMILKRQISSKEWISKAIGSFLDGVLIIPLPRRKMPLLVFKVLKEPLKAYQVSFQSPVGMKKEWFCNFLPYWEGCFQSRIPAGISNTLNRLYSEKLEEVIEIPIKLFHKNSQVKLSGQIVDYVNEVLHASKFSVIVKGVPPGHHDLIVSKHDEVVFRNGPYWKKGKPCFRVSDVVQEIVNKENRTVSRDKVFRVLKSRYMQDKILNKNWPSKNKLFQSKVISYLRKIYPQQKYVTFFDALESNLTSSNM